MISREWTCELKPGKNSEYEDFLKEEIIPGLGKIEGFRGASIKKRIGSEYIFSSKWENLEVIREFAGEDISKAVVKEKAQRMMTRFDKEVKHYEIIHEH